jgi:hypothetical protein
MRGRRRHIASVIAEALASRPDARLAAAAAAFAEACGRALSREARLRSIDPEGRLVVAVRSAAWAREVSHLAPTLCARVNARLGVELARSIEVRIWPPGPER